MKENCKRQGGYEMEGDRSNFCSTRTSSLKMELNFQTNPQKDKLCENWKFPKKDHRGDGGPKRMFNRALELKKRNI
jgi:hypothetical protein